MSNQASESSSSSSESGHGVSKPKPSFAAMAARPAKPLVAQVKTPTRPKVPTVTYGKTYVVELAIPEHRKQLKVGDYVVTTDLTKGRRDKPVVLQVKTISDGEQPYVEFVNGLPGRWAMLDNYGKTYHPCVMMRHVSGQRGYVFDMAHNKNNKTTYSVRMNGAVYYPTDDNMKGFQKE